MSSFLIHMVVQQVIQYMFGGVVLRFLGYGILIVLASSLAHSLPVHRPAFSFRHVLLLSRMSGCSGAHFDPVAHWTMPFTSLFC